MTRLDEFKAKVAAMSAEQIAESEELMDVAYELSKDGDGWCNINRCFYPDDESRDNWKPEDCAACRANWLNQEVPS